MRRSAVLPLLALTALAGPVAQSAAQDPAAPEPTAASVTATTPTPPPPEPEPVEPAPKPKPKPGKASIGIDDGVPTRKLAWVARGDKVLVRGTVKPFVPGQFAVLEVRRKGKLVGRKRTRIVREKRRTGKVAARVKLRAKGVYKLRWRHPRSERQRAFRSKVRRVKSVVLRNGEGASGTGVLILQRGLRNLGYAVPRSGSYDDATARAVIAFRKANGMSRIGYASPKVYSMVLRRHGAFKPKYPKAGYHVEYDWSRQVLGFFRGGKPVNVYHSSSGAPATPTVFGTFTFYRKQPGTNSLGMVDSNYFIRGYAIHGYKSVPTYPASHGCLRVPIPNAAEVDRQISLGMKIMVYR